MMSLPSIFEQVQGGDVWEASEHSSATRTTLCFPKLATGTDVNREHWVWLDLIESKVCRWKIEKRVVLASQG